MYMRLLATRLAGMKRGSRKKRERCVSHEVVGEEESRCVFLWDITISMKGRILR